MQSGSDNFSGPNGPNQMSDPSAEIEADVNNFLPSEEEEIVQVVYRSNPSGSLVAVESSLIPASQGNSNYAHSDSNSSGGQHDYFNGQLGRQLESSAMNAEGSSQPLDGAVHQPLVRAASTLPSVAEESSSGAGGFQQNNDELLGVAPDMQCLDERTSRSISQANEEFAMDDDEIPHQLQQQQQSGGPLALEPPEAACCVQDLLSLDGGELTTDFCMNPHAIYSTVSKQSATNRNGIIDNSDSLALISNQQNLASSEAEAYTALIDSTTPGSEYANDENQQPDYLKDEYLEEKKTDLEKKDIEEINAEICQIISRQKQGAAESGSLRSNFKKKLVLSSSTNENELTAHRQKLLDSQDHGNNVEGGDDGETLGSLPNKFKRTHSVSFNVGSSRNSRHSVDIRNLPSYLTVKRASIVDVAKGAMSSLIHSFGGSGGGGGTAGSSISNSRRDSAIDEEPIFEEPIAPTLSLGQRVALVKNNGAEFGTVGWIGQLPDVDDDWVVGVIFDNMIGNCDGAHNGVRYFYSRENFAMFVPLSALTKTDNYIGRPETGTMLSRMSVSLKPGQLISIQRSSIRLQHCFLNAPHQRVGHDVRAVSNRLHCQCHNCGPCAHLTKQHSRINALPAFGAHHAVNKKNSLAHAAVEILAHHHHHYHEEEHHEEEDYQFGDNAAHACNFVRYSCCQQNGGAGHEFSSDCGLVRPELLDNLIHAPRAPHRRSRARRMRRYITPVGGQDQRPICGLPPTQQIGTAAANSLEGPAQLKQIEASEQNEPADQKGSDSANASSGDDDQDDVGSRSSACSTCSSQSSPSRGQGGETGHYSQNTNQSYQVDSMNYFQGSTIYNTLESRMSLHDQQRFIYQRESNVSVRSSRRQGDDYDDYDERQRSNIGLIPRLRRCFGCLRRGGEPRRRRPKKRKLSARNRLIEYRRKQSTFVPSTLAKPQDDFASHGIILPSWDPSNQNQPGDYNSDYSSYSNKSSGSSPSNSPRREAHNHSSSNYATQQQQQQFISIDHSVPVGHGEQLKGRPNDSVPSGQLNYDDYTFDNDGYGSYEEKFALSLESDLGYFDLMTSSSGGTLKNIVDHAIDREESLRRLAPIEMISPIQTESFSNSSDQVEISSPTLSMADQGNGDDELNEPFEGLNLGKEPSTNQSP